MGKVMEIIIVANALCGVAAFLIARGLINKGRRKLHDVLRDDEEARKEIRQ